MANLAELLTSKIPPHSLEAERAVLGAILLERESLPRAIELLKPSDFYKEGHRKIFDTMLGLFERNEPVDLLTLSEELKRQNHLEAVGGPAALAALVEEAATSAHLVAYGSIVREKALLRDLIRVSTEVISQSYDGSQEVEKLLDDAERLIFQISERRMQGSAFPVRAILKDTFEHIERLYERKEHVTGLATGFGKLDEMTSGFQSSDFIIIAGRPSMGKTAFALNIAKYAGVVDHKRVLVLSLEMSKEQLVQR
jgi:replicative DNA helicase